MTNSKPLEEMPETDEEFQKRKADNFSASIKAVMDNVPASLERNPPDKEFTEAIDAFKRILREADELKELQRKADHADKLAEALEALRHPGLAVDECIMCALNPDKINAHIDAALTAYREKEKS